MITTEQAHAMGFRPRDGGSGNVTVTMQHCREIGYCARGVRYFFALHELDFGKFLAEGVPSCVLKATGDAMALAAVERARRG